MSKHNRERRLLRRKKAEGIYPLNQYELTRMFRHGKKRLRGKSSAPTSQRTK